MPPVMTLRTAGRAARAAALRAGHVLAALACLATGPALAGSVPLVQLIEEKARDSAGPAMPPRGRFDISVQSGAPDEGLLISAWWNDPATGRFAANVVTEKGDVRRVNGLATLIVPVPVPVRRLMPGEIVADTDLGMIDLPASRIGAFTITDPAELVGMQVRSLLTEGRAVAVQAVMQPLVIGRGSLVSIRYSDGALELSAPGRALGDAHRGQEVRIVNLVSNTALVGIATAEGIVEVRR